jgi:hypothetical protein
MKKKIVYIILVIILFNVLAISVLANKFSNENLNNVLSLEEIDNNIPRNIIKENVNENVALKNDWGDNDWTEWPYDVPPPSTKGMENLPPIYPDFLDNIISLPRTIIYKIGSPYFTVNGVQKEIDSDGNTSPVIVDGRTLIPIRSLIEELGGAVSWNADTRTVGIFYNKIHMALTIDKTDVVITDLKTMEKSNYTLDVPAQIIDGRTMVPLRFVTEQIGGKVSWNEKSQEVTIKFNIE